MCKQKLDRYAAKLLFQFEKFKGKLSLQKRRICEIKIIIFNASGSEYAYDFALEKGISEEFEYTSEGYLIKYKFIGLIELINLEDEDDDVVWWEFKEILLPMEKKKKFIPKKSDLSVFKDITNKRRGKIKI